MTNIIFIGIGILILLLFLFSVSIIHIRALIDDLNLRWYNLVEKLQYRHRLAVVVLGVIGPMDDVRRYPRQQGLKDLPRRRLLHR